MMRFGEFHVEKYVRFCTDDPFALFWTVSVDFSIICRTNPQSKPPGSNQASTGRVQEQIGNLEQFLKLADSFAAV
jgi:hypothetical protein